MSGIQDNNDVKNFQINNCQMVVIGDGNMLTSSETQGNSIFERADLNSYVQKPSSNLPILPGKPFHMCQTRRKELSTITSMYEDMTSSSDEPVITTLYLTGPPGSGKTQLARQFGEQFFKTMPNCNTNYPPLALTLNAESVESLLKTTKDVTKKLGLTAEPKKRAEGYHEMYLVRFHLEELRKFLQSYCGIWLLILDNMFDGEEINDILPQPGSKDWGEGKVLVTSQDNDIVPACHEYARMHSLNNGMTEEDGLDLLKKVSGVDVDQFAVQLAEESRFFPLALACAATYVGQTRQDRASSRFSWEQYLVLHHEEKYQLEYRTFSKNNVYPITTMAAATLAVKRMSERSDVLRLTFDFLSYCAMHPVPLVLLANIVHANLPPGQSQSCGEIEAEICRCSLLIHAQSGFTACVETVKFHQVMNDAFQHVRDERSAESNESEFVAILKSLNENLKPTDECSDQFVSIAIKILMRPHLQSFVDHANAKKWNKTAEFVLLTMKVGQFLYQVSNMPVAQVVESLESAHQIAVELQLSNIQHCDILANIGFYNLELYNLDKAVQILNEAYAMTEGQKDQEWLKLKCRILNNLSRSYYFLGKQRLATENMRRSIDIAKVVFDEDMVMDRFFELASFYFSKFEIVKMKEVCDEASQFLLTRETDGKSLKRASSLNTLGALTLLLWVFSWTDNSDKLYDAECFFAQSLEIYEDILGKDIYSCSYLGYKLVAYAFFCHSVEDLILQRELMERAENIFTQSQETFGLSLVAAYNKHYFNVEPKVDWVSFFLAPLFAETRSISYHSKSAIEDVLDDCKSEKIRPSRRWEERFRRCRSLHVMVIWLSYILNFLVWMLVLFIIAYWQHT